MEEIKKDGKVIAVVGSPDEALWKRVIDNSKARIEATKESLKVEEVLLLAAERELLKAQRNHKPS